MEMGDLPEGWRSCQLADATLPYKTCDPLKQPETSFTYIDLSSVDNELGRIVSPKVLHGKDAPSRARKVVKAGDVIFATTRPYLKGIALVPAEYDGQICSTGFSVLRAQQDVLLPQWLYYACRSDLVLDQVLPHMRGASYPAVTDKDVLAATIPIPPLSEQQRIVARIEELAAKIERACELRREAAQEVEAIYDAAVTEVLNSLVDAELVTIDTIADVRGGVQKGPHRAAANNPVRYLTVAHVQRNRISLDDPRYFEVSVDELERWRLEPGDVLMIEGNGSANEIGRTALFKGELRDCVHQNHVIRIRPDQTRINPEFLNVYLNSPVGRAEVQAQSQSTSGLRTLSVNRIKQIKVVLPLLNEQRSIMAYLDSVQVKADVLKRLQAESVTELDALLPTVLTRAFRGEL